MTTTVICAVLSLLILLGTAVWLLAASQSTRDGSLRFMAVLLLLLAGNHLLLLSNSVSWLSLKLVEPLGAATGLLASLTALATAWYLRRSAERLEVTRRQNQKLTQELLQAATDSSSELRKSEARYRSLAKASPVGVFRTTTKGICQYVNHRWTEITAVPAQDARGKEWIPLVHHEDQERVRAAWQQATASLMPFDCEFRHQHPNDEVIWVFGQGMPEENVGGEETAYICTLTDITRQKNAERLLELAKQAAERASQMKSQFLANMSHEIRTPMTGIIGMTDLVLNSELSDEQRRDLEMAQRSAYKLLAIIDDILDFSKIEVGKLTLEAIGFNVAEVLEDSLRPLRLKAEEKGLELASTIATDIPEEVVGDPVRLHQIVTNLVANAVKFTDTGRVTIHVDVDARDSEGVVLYFVVTDTGIGIDPEHLRVIFDSFAQADPSMARRFGGTGLGLSISAKLAEMMGGTMWVDSELGKGSRFRFTARFGLPSGSHTATIPAGDTAAQELRDRGPLRVLLVEDNDVNQELIGRLLANWEYTVRTAGNGREALKALETEPFDLVLMDVRMPEMDGYEATRAIRHQEQKTGKHLPIVALTAHAMPADRQQCLQAGMDAYASKPINDNELTQAIVTAFRRAADTGPGGPGL